MTIAELKEKNITELTKIARTLDLPGASGMRKQDLIFKILQAQSEKEGHIFAEGVLEIRDHAGIDRAIGHRHGELVALALVMQRRGALQPGAGAAEHIEA